MAVVKEKSTGYITMVFKDKNGTPVAPVSISYLVDDLTTGEVLQTVEAGVVAPASTVEITIPASVNRIVTSGRDKEAHRLTVTAVYGASAQQTEEFLFYVKALGAVT